MENTTTLLVAIMFTTIVTISLGNVLMALAGIVRGQAKPDGVHLGWILLLPVVHVILFWQTTEVLDFESWTLLRFMSFLLGPIILLFASSLLIDLPTAETPDRAGHFASLSRRFFVLLSLFCVWLALLDLLTGMVLPQTYAAGALGVLCIALMLMPGRRFQQFGVVAGWLLFLGSLAGA